MFNISYDLAVLQTKENNPTAIFRVRDLYLDPEAIATQMFDDTSNGIMIDTSRNSRGLFIATDVGPKPVLVLTRSVLSPTTVLSIDSPVIIEFLQNTDWKKVARDIERQVATSVKKKYAFSIRGVEFNTYMSKVEKGGNRVFDNYRVLVSITQCVSHFAVVKDWMSALKNYLENFSNCGEWFFTPDHSCFWVNTHSEEDAHTALAEFTKRCANLALELDLDTRSIQPLTVLRQYS